MNLFDVRVFAKLVGNFCHWNIQALSTVCDRNRSSTYIPLLIFAFYFNGNGKFLFLQITELFDIAYQAIFDCKNSTKLSA